MQRHLKHAFAKQRCGLKTKKADAFGTGLSSLSVGAAGFEPDMASAIVTDSSGIMAVHDVESSASSVSKSVNAGDRSIEIDRYGDPVEAALAAALEGATRAGEWSTVARLASELEARRLARSEVVDLGAERRRRERG